MFFELSRNGERTAHFRCALTTQAGLASSGAVLNGRTAPTTKRDFSPEKAEHQRPREHSLRLLPQLVTTPTRTQVLGQL